MRHHHIASGLLTGALVAGGVTSGITTGLLQPASASAVPGASQFFIPEEFDGTEHMAADDNPCGAWSGTLHEIRHGGYHVLLPAGGQTSGEAHINGSVDGWIQLTPDDPSLPTYTGTYREKVDGVLADPDNDQFRVMRFQLRDALTGSDGTKLVLVLGEKVTVDANGRTIVDRSVATCG